MSVAKGVQLWSVREEVKQDLPGTLRRLADMGYEGVEFCGAPSAPAPEIKDMLAATGLACCGWHVLFDNLKDDRIEETVEFHKSLGNPYLIVPFLGGIETLAGWRERAAFFNILSQKLARSNLRVGFHNHRGEFEPLEGKRPHDVFFANTDAGVIMQLDIGHAAGGGVDPLDVIKRYPGRAVTVHAKPYSLEAGREDVKAGYRPCIGEDGLPWPEILDTCRHTGGTLWCIVEYESDAYPSLVAVERCLKALQDM